ncbi:Uncharacterised protein [uncultured archaeon]|nr:Uncharacterised protein [uncultured archaeon]
MAEIPQLLDNAWKNFVKFYDKRFSYYQDYDPQAHNCVCWKEIDVMGHLMRFLYEEFKIIKINNIEIHLNCPLKPNNYLMEGNEDFCSSLESLQSLFAGRRIEVDIAFAKEDSVPFELCLEAKHFHYPVSTSEYPDFRTKDHIQP